MAPTFDAEEETRVLELADGSSTLSFFPSLRKETKLALSAFLEHLKTNGTQASLWVEGSGEVRGREVKCARGSVMTQDPAGLREATQKHQKFQRNRSIFQPSLLI